MIKFAVLNRWSGDVQFIADVDCEESASGSIKLSLAVRWAYNNGANLVGANLVGANLVGANLVGANLDGANLVGANLRGANLRSIRADLFDVLLRARPEVPALLQALRDGRVDGSTYNGDCACLCGTIANARHVNVSALDFVDSSRPAERWFLGIKEGDTPATSSIVKITEGWIEEFLTFAAPNAAVQTVE